MSKNLHAQNRRMGSHWNRITKLATYAPMQCKSVFFLLLLLWLKLRACHSVMWLWQCITVVTWFFFHLSFLFSQDNSCMNPFQRFHCARAKSLTFELRAESVFSAEEFLIRVLIRQIHGLIVLRKWFKFY